MDFGDNPAGRGVLTSQSLAIFKGPLSNQLSLKKQVPINLLMRSGKKHPDHRNMPVFPVFSQFKIGALFLPPLTLPLPPILNDALMYAIVDIAGKQFKVLKDQYIYAPRIEGEAGTPVEFDQVLLIDNEGTVQVGVPTVAGIKVSGKILEQVKGDKEIVFKKKRRKGYAVKNGHRQQFTKIQIEKIG